MVGLQYIGAGIACCAMGMAALSVGNIFSNFLSGALRNPGAAEKSFTHAMIGAALAEGLGLFCFIIAIMMII